MARASDVSYAIVVRITCKNMIVASSSSSCERDAARPTVDKEIREHSHGAINMMRRETKLRDIHTKIVAATNIPLPTKSSTIDRSSGPAGGAIACAQTPPALMNKMEKSQKESVCRPSASRERANWNWVAQRQMRTRTEGARRKERVWSW